MLDKFVSKSEEIYCMKNNVSIRKIYKNYHQHNEMAFPIISKAEKVDYHKQKSRTEQKSGSTLVIIKVCRNMEPDREGQ